MAGQVRRLLTRNEMLVLLVPGSVGVACIFALAVTSLGLTETLLCVFAFTTVVAFLAAITQTLSGGRFPDKHLWLKTGVSLGLLVAVLAVDSVRDDMNPDVRAARACRVLHEFAAGRATAGQVEDAALKLTGSDHEVGGPAKWADLGVAMSTFAAEVVGGEQNIAVSLVDQISDGCAAIPPGAAVRGGYVNLK